jgi:hypothetical protein
VAVRTFCFMSVNLAQFWKRLQGKSDGSSAGRKVFSKGNTP